MQINEILNLIAIFIAPIIAVAIGKLLQDRSEKRKDKMAVFKAVMTYRYTKSIEAIHAFNSIPIVYAKDKKVRECWKTLYEDYCNLGPEGNKIKKKDDDLYKLLESMAEVLGYKQQITWEDIQNPYRPTGMVKKENNNEIINERLASILLRMTNTDDCQQEETDND